MAICSAGKAEAWESRKRGAYPVWLERRRRVRGDFSPIVFEHYGFAGEQTLETLRSLAMRSAAAAGLPGAREVERWLELLAARVQLENAAMLAEG